MRIPSGVTDQVIYFVAVDSADYVTRETGLTTFTVYRSRDGGTAAAMTTPTVTEVDATNMPGVYKLLVDEDTTIAAGNDSEEMCFHITQASMAPVTRTIEIYRPKVTAGNTLGVAADGDISGNVDGAVASLGTTAKSDVNAEVVDVLNTDTFAEPGQGAPASTTTLAEKLGYLYKWARNKKDNDGTTTQYYADDGTTVDQKASTSAASGTTTVGEIETGP